MRTLLSLFLIGFLQAEEWPRIFKPSPSIAKYQVLGQEDGLFQYRTKHYRIASDRTLRPSLLADFTRSAEAVALVLEKIPLPLSSPPEKDLPLIRICANEATFLSAGGAKGAAGFYNGRKQEVLILWDQFFPENGGGLGPRANFSLLVHELAHLQMHGHLWKMRPWFYEGVAEYVAAAHEKGGVFNFSKMEGKVRERIKSHTNPAADGSPVMSLAKLIQLSSRKWHHLAETQESYELLEIYSSSLLLTHYYFHGGDERRKEVDDYLAKIEEVKDIRDERPLLLNGEEAAEIEKKLVAYWSSRGLKLRFR